MRGFKTFAGVRVLCPGHAFLRDLRGGFYELVGTVATAPQPSVVREWVALTGILPRG